MIQCFKNMKVGIYYPNIYGTFFLQLVLGSSVSITFAYGSEGPWIDSWLGQH